MWTGNGPFKPGPKYQISFPLDYGYAFLLTELIFRQDSGWAGTVKIEVINKARGREYQLTPFYPRLVSSPAEGDNFTNYCSPSPAPVDNDALGRSNLSQGPKNRIQINQFYHYRENIFVNVFLDDFLYGLYSPSYADFLLLGYLIPERKLAMWR